MNGIQSCFWKPNLLTIISSTLLPLKESRHFICIFLILFLLKLYLMFLGKLYHLQTLSLWLPCSWGIIICLSYFMLNSILPHSVLPILERFIFIMLKYPLEPETLFFFSRKAGEQNIFQDLLYFSTFSSLYMLVGGLTVHRVTDSCSSFHESWSTLFISYLYK